MIFRKDIEPCCVYCSHGNSISETEVICLKHGVVPSCESCRSFGYDPLKREPPRPQMLDTSKFSLEDFEL